jgi:hypothetical protein
MSQAITSYYLKDSLISHNMLDKFKQGDGFHNMASTGKNSCSVAGKGRVLMTVKGWRLIFQALYQEATNLAKSLKGDRVRIFGIWLAMTAPKSIFKGAN